MRAVTSDAAVAFLLSLVDCNLQFQGPDPRFQGRARHDALERGQSVRSLLLLTESAGSQTVYKCTQPCDESNNNKTIKQSRNAACSWFCAGEQKRSNIDFTNVPDFGQNSIDFIYPNHFLLKSVRAQIERTRARRGFDLEERERSRRAYLLPAFIARLFVCLSPCLLVPKANVAGLRSLHLLFRSCGGHFPASALLILLTIHSLLHWDSRVIFFRPDTIQTHHLHSSSRRHAARELARVVPTRCCTEASRGYEKLGTGRRAKRAPGVRDFTFGIEASARLQTNHTIYYSS